MKVVVLDPSCLNRLYTHNLCQALISQGCEVDLVASQFLYLDQDVASGSYKKWEHFYRGTTKLYREKPRGFLRRYVKGLEHVVNLTTLPKFIKSLKPDIIHFQQAPIPIVDRWVLSSLKKIAPLISTVHNTEPFHGDASWLQKSGFGGLLRGFDQLIAHTEYSRKVLVKTWGVNKDQISVVPLGLYDHYKDFAQPESEQTVSDKSRDEKNILFFGNISHYKGLDVLIEAFAKLPESTRQKARLLICGNPQFPIDPLKDLAKNLGIEDKITWDLRFIPEEQIHGVFIKSDMLVLPYRHIDGSGVLTTALKYAKPIIASRIGGFDEALTDGVHGCMVEPDNADALAKGLDTVLSDPDLAQRMGEAVKELSRQWRSWNDIAGEAIHIYQDLKEKRNNEN